MNITWPYRSVQFEIKGWKVGVVSPTGLVRITTVYAGNPGSRYRELRKPWVIHVYSQEV